MGNFFERINVNMPDGVFSEILELKPGLNIIAGENGTYKTKLLQYIRANYNHTATYNSAIRMAVQAISPKRNAQRKAIETVLNEMRQNGVTLDIIQQQRESASINDSTFEDYPSLTQTYFAMYQHRLKGGGEQEKHMNEVTVELNAIIQSIFDKYVFEAEWDRNLGSPRIWINKRNAVRFPVEGLSLGEQDVMSLAVSLHAAKDRVDVFLIDEPESHLNWHLEKRLFDYLDGFCESNDKQMIVVTHSRVIFNPKFMPKVSFLYWSSDQKIALATELPLEHRLRLAGETLEIIAPMNPEIPFFFVEDTAHRGFIISMARAMGHVVDNISICGNSSNVKSAYNSSGLKLPNTYFLVDGDNQGNPYPNDPKFIHLPVYCIENYLLHPELAAEALGVSTLEVQVSILEAIKSRKKEMKQNPNQHFLLELLDVIEPEKLTFDRLSRFDASKVIETFSQKFGLDQYAYRDKFLEYLANLGKVESLFPPALIDAVKASPIAEATVIGE